MRPRMSLALAVSCTPGDAEFVDPVVQGGDVLLESELAKFFLGFRLQRGNQFWLAGVAAFGNQQVGLAVANREACLVAGFDVAEFDDAALAFTIDAAVAQVLVAHHGAQVGRGRVELFGQRALHVDLQQEVHAAAQVEAEIHRQRPQRSQPLRRCRQQIQGDDVLRVGGIRVEGLFQDILGLQLGIGVLEARLDAVEIKLDAVVRDAGSDQGFFNTGLGLGIDLDRGLGAGNLHGRRFAEEIGQGIDEAQHQRDGDGDVLP